MKQGRGNGNNLSWEFRIWVGWVLFVNCISRTPQLYFIFWEEKEIIFRGNWSWDGGSSAAEWFSPEFWEKPSGRGRSDRPSISFAPFLFVFIFVFVFGSSDRPTISFASFVFVFILVFVFGSSDRPTTSFALFCIYIMALVYFQICQQCQNLWLGMNVQNEEVMNIFFLATYWDVSVGCFVHFFVCQNSICFHWN